MFERKTILFPGDSTCPFRSSVYGCLCGGDGGYVGVFFKVCFKVLFLREVTSISSCVLSLYRVALRPDTKLRPSVRRAWNHQHCNDGTHAGGRRYSAMLFPPLINNLLKMLFALTKVCLRVFKSQIWLLVFERSHRY